MKLRAAVAVIAFAVVGALAGGIVAALWSGTQTTSGSVNATSSSVDLYICEPNADPANTGCGPDDSGADETIFEGTENLMPGSIVAAPVRLRNVGSTDLDILRANVLIQKVSDPGNDCPTEPWVRGDLVGKYWFNYQYNQYNYICGSDTWGGLALNDNHPEGDSIEHGLPVIPTTGLTSTVPYRCDTGSSYGVHIAAGDYEDMAVEVRLSSTAPAECEDAVWDISVDWEVVSTGY